MREKSQFAEARVLASQALDLAQRFRVPPYPRAYEVWFTYASGGNAELNAHLDKVLAEQDSVPPSLIDQLYNDYLSPGAMNAGVERIGAQANAELGQVIDLLEGGMVGGERMGRALESAERSLNRARTAEERANAMAQLRDEQRLHARSVQMLSGNLDTMRSQFITMQRELRELRQSVLLDPVTQLPNHRFLGDALGRLVAEGTPVGRSGRGACLGFLDVDGLSAVNRQWGRRIGDAVMAECAGMVRRVLAEGDVAVRLENDRIALLLRQRHSEETATLVTGLQAAVSAIRLTRGDSEVEDGYIRGIAGFAFLQNGDTPAMLFARAEETLALADSATAPGRAATG
ncbi:MAG: GGDEF domain-containing protein [Pseudomonadota bacterium]